MSVISAAKFKASLDKWGVNYVEHSRRDRCLGRTVSWAEHEARRGRDCARRSWDARGIAIHHSGGPTSWEFVWDGRSDVPGPLYTAIIYPDGVAHLTGFRITNNVGGCDATIRNRVLRGDMPTSGGNVSPGADDFFAANSEFYGLSYRGTAPNAAQRRTALLMTCAICDAHGDTWDGGSVAGHKELTRRKPDPEGENMSTFRREVNAQLAVGPPKAGGGAVSYNENWRTDEKMRAPKDLSKPTNTHWWPESVLEHVADEVLAREYRSPWLRDHYENKRKSSRYLLEWAEHKADGARTAAQENTRQIAALSAQVAALTSAIEQLSSGGVDMTAVKQAAMAGAAEALRGVNVQVTFDEDDPTEE